MTVSRLFPLALAFGVALIIAISTVFTFINGYREDLIYQIKRRGQTLKKNAKPNEEATSSYRLPKYIRPISYDIYIHPNLTTFKFSGKIKLRCYRQTKKVMLHAHDLRIVEIKIMDTKQKRLRISRGMRHGRKQQYVIIMKEDLKEMATYELYLAFNGALSDGLEGFYKSSYKARRGNVRYLATTQFEATNARSAFPCFDEPAFKAIFRITIVHDDSYRALSNMPLESRDRRYDGLLESHFRASAPMPTYLVTFIVCDFEHKEASTKSGKTIRVWSKPDAVNSTEFALNAAEHALEYYEEFFNISYPLPKMDLIAIPDMGGAMENWGIITFRESALLFDPITGSAADQKLVAMIVNHEVAHQWFGNLVTMSWWNDLWLNEGFAVYLEYLATDDLNYKWKRADEFMLDSLREALNFDISLYTHPVSVEVQNPAQINEIVDKITYHKSSALIRMMQSFLGDETLRKGIEIYLRKHQFANAKVSDLWKAMSEASGNLVDVETVMESWINQKGFPLISILRNKVQKKDGKLSFIANQKRFLRDFTTAKLENDQSKELGWYIPLTYITEGSVCCPKTVWMNKTSSVTFELSSYPSGWIKANVGQTAFFRVNYDEENWKRLSQQLIHNHTTLSELDRSGLIDDALSLARAGVLDYPIALHLTQYIRNERNYVPWAVMLRSLSYIDTMLRWRRSYKLYQQFIVEKLKPLKDSLGWEDSDALVDRIFRELVVSTLSFHDDEDTVNKLKLLFSNWMKTNGTQSVPSHLRKTMYIAAVKYGGEREWEFFWRKYKQCKNAAQREKIITALGSAKSKQLLHRLLKHALDDKIVRTQDMIQIIGTVASNTKGRLLAWKFFKRNHEKITKRLGKDSRAVMFLLERVTENLNTVKLLKEVKDFIQTHHSMSSLQSNKKILETVKCNIHWMATKLTSVENWLEGRYRRQHQLQ
ncbi:unnamed protein product [Porites lobata]|uniref:Aminopeptidase n=1 Tax=Porites lobata TaxID=104759 RepID=A0ABN8QH67_9CNID|nr:unnamed protein product [Porites lobata]